MSDDWEMFTQSVTPVNSKRSHVRAPKTSASKVIASAAFPPINQEARPVQLGDVGGLTPQRQKQLRRGEFPIEATLDLHGMREEAAFKAFQQFIMHQKAARFLLVITGKGENQQGVLKCALPQWCEHPTLSHRILVLTHAHPSHGGSGAYYVTLRRQKE